MKSEIVRASVITIGDELLIGQVIDTNSAFLSQVLNRQGIWVRKRVSVGDDYEEIRKALDQESNESQIILITGGLGPTADDITKPLLCEYFGSRLVVNQEVLKHVTHLFENVFKRPLTDINKKQAEVPEICTVLHNERGTAPGMLFEKNGVLYISMPGVPYEMKGMMVDIVLPLLAKKFSNGFILHRTLLTAGIGESALAEHISIWETSLPSHLKLAYLPNYGMVRLRITGTGTNEQMLQSEIDDQFMQLKLIVKQWLVTDQDVSLPQLVSQMLKAGNKTIGTVESCTGGYISHLFTSEPGSSKIFKGAIVSYSNDVKKDMLDVKQQTLDNNGAVSEETVKEMVKGALAVLHSDYCIATSGIMGPDGGTALKPVGTVWIAVGNRNLIWAQQFHFRFDRIRNIELTANQAFNLLRKFMLNEEQESAVQ